MKEVGLCSCDADAQGTSRVRLQGQPEGDQVSAVAPWPKIRVRSADLTCSGFEGQGRIL